MEGARKTVYGSKRVLTVPFDSPPKAGTGGAPLKGASWGFRTETPRLQRSILVGPQDVVRGFASILGAPQLGFWAARKGLVVWSARNGDKIPKLPRGAPGGVVPPGAGTARAGTAGSPTHPSSGDLACPREGAPGKHVALILLGAPQGTARSVGIPGWSVMPRTMPPALSHARATPGHSLTNACLCRCR